MVVGVPAHGDHIGGWTLVDSLTFVRRSGFPTSVAGPLVLALEVR